jgi:hypothetical protein
MCWQKLMTVCSPTHRNTWNADQNTMLDVFIRLINIQCFSSYKNLYYLPVRWSKWLVSPITKIISLKKEMTHFQSGQMLCPSQVSGNSWLVPKGWTLLDVYDRYWPVSHIRLTCKYIWISGQSALSSMIESNSDRSAFKARPLGPRKAMSISTH